MATTNINSLTALGAVATDDFLPLWDTSAGVTRKSSVTAILASRLTGTGVVATGTNTLTVPATGTAALRDVANTFTAAQTIAPAAGVVPLILNGAAGTTQRPLIVQLAGVERLSLRASATETGIVLNDFDNDAGAGTLFYAGRNNDGVTPAGGAIGFQAMGGTSYYVWADNSGNLRIKTSPQPTNATDTGGTVVGAQTSNLAAKDVLGPPATPGEALAHLHHAAKVALRRFRYKSGAYNDEEFEGLVVDYAPRYGMDAGRSLNLPTVVSDLIQAVTMLAERVEQLEGKQ